MKQNRLKSLKICQGIRYKRLLEASGFSKRYGIFFGHVRTRHFRRSYLKVSKSEGTRKVEHVCHCYKCADAVYQKLSKLVHACRN